MNDLKSTTQPETTRQPDSLFSLIGIIGMLLGASVIIPGLLGQAYLVLTFEWQFQVLGLLSYLLGAIGVLLFFSKAKKSAHYGAFLIFTAIALSVALSISTDFSSETQHTAVITIGFIIFSISGILYRISLWIPTRIRQTKAQ